jgi:hypothetical protein
MIICSCNVLSDHAVRTANGHTAAPPRPAMNPRRRICHPSLLARQPIAAGVLWERASPGPTPRIAVCSGGVQIGRNKCLRRKLTPPLT